MKYELTTETLIINEHTLYRIKALKDFNDVNKNQLGGFIEKVENLSQEGNCWIYNDARVFGNAVVSDNAWVSANAKVYENAWVYGNARVHDNASVFGSARVSGNARVFENAWVLGYTEVSGNAWVYDNARVSGDTRVYENTWVYENTVIQSVYVPLHVCARLDINKSKEPELIKPIITNSIFCLVP